MKIKFSQEVHLYRWVDQKAVAIEDPDILKTLDNIKYKDEEFSDYLCDSEDDKEKFGHLDIQGGHLVFEYSEDKNNVFVTTEYSSRESLSDQDIENLKEYTGGQWTSGIGDSFFQSFEFGPEITIDVSGNLEKIEHEIFN